MIGYYTAGVTPRSKIFSREKTVSLGISKICEWPAIP